MFVMSVIGCDFLIQEARPPADWCRQGSGSTLARLPSDSAGLSAQGLRTYVSFCQSISQHVAYGLKDRMCLRIFVSSDIMIVKTMKKKSTIKISSSKTDIENYRVCDDCYHV